MGVAGYSPHHLLLSLVPHEGWMVVRTEERQTSDPSIKKEKALTEKFRWLSLTWAVGMRL